jgi:triphosphatase
MTENGRAELIDQLKAQRQPLAPEDSMSEAGRKVMLGQFIQMLENEDSAKDGSDPEGVHDMRVATRRLRSTLRMLEAQYKPKTALSLEAELKRLARALGAVRDLDVLIEGLRTFHGPLAEDNPARAAVQQVIDAFNAELSNDRYRLIRTLEKKSTDRFYRDFAQFLITPGSGARAAASDVQPQQVRHALPPLIYEHLAAVRAYDTVLAGADDETLHMLRIEFKRLRYAVTLFQDVLGAPSKEFLKELSVFQDHLGRMQDIVTAQDRVGSALRALPDDVTAGMAAYYDALNHEHAALREGLADRWKRFNSKAVMSKLASAIAVL